MPIRILIDNLRGEPGDLYHLVREEIAAREIPEVTISDHVESRASSGGIGGWFSEGEQIPSIGIANKQQECRVIAYQYGRAFSVSAYAWWTDLGFSQKAQQNKLSFGEDIYSGCFLETVTRAVKTAVARYAEKAQINVSVAPDPREVFFGPKD